MGTVEIHVTDRESGTPLRGADVGIYLVDLTRDEEAVRPTARLHRATTDEFGRCTIRAEIAVGARVRVRSFVRARGRVELRGPGLVRRARGTPHVDDDPTLADGQTVRIAAALERGPTLRGCVTDAEGPVAGAHIGLVCSSTQGCTWPHALSVGRDAHWPPRVETDEHGNFEWLSFPLGLVRHDPSWHYVLLAESETHATAMVHRVETLPAGDGGVIDVSVRLEPGATLDGRVVGADGTPVRAAKVEAVAAPLPDQPGCVRFDRHATTDGYGRFRLTGLARRAHAVKVEAADHTPWSGDVDLGSGPATLPDVRLDAGCDLEGGVVDRDGAPLANVEVFGSMQDLGVFRRARTDAAGRFRLDGLPLRGRLEVRCSLLTGTEVDLPSPPVTLRAPTFAALRVELVADESGEPIDHPQAVVTAFGTGFSSAITRDAHGVLIRPRTPAGPYRLEVHVPDRAPASASVELPEGGLTAPVVIRVPQGGAARGVARDVPGHPLAGVTVLAYGQASLYPQRAVTDANGAYLLQGLGPRAYLVFTRSDLALFAQVVRETGSAGAPVTFDVTMGAGATVTGRVARPDGSPAARAHVSVAPADGRHVPFELPAALTDEAGRFELTRVPEGEFVVRSGEASAPIRAKHGARIEVSLSAR